MAKKKLSKEDIEAEAINIVEKEIKTWELATFFVTDKVSFNMRKLIPVLRKNYWGVFDVPRDPITGRKKLWKHLTKSTVHDFWKNIDLDTKDINFRSRTREGIPTTDLIRGKVREILSAHLFEGRTFGELLDETEIQLAIDGTVVWKTVPEKYKKTVMPCVRQVDLMNCYIDPTAQNINQAFRFTERAILLPDEIQGMEWMNKDKVAYHTGFHPSDNFLNNSTTTGTSQQIDVYEMWGYIPKYLITGLRDDKDLIKGRIVVSGLQFGPRSVHVIEENTNKDKDGEVITPYEEGRLFKVASRWYGQGVAEMMMFEQEYGNLVRNLRINKNNVAHLGLFKIKQGANITQSDIKNMISNGVIKLQNMDDMDSLNIPPADMTSYKDEELIENEARKLASTYQGTTGEPLPASTPATNAVIQNQNAQSLFTIMKESIGMFLKRWCDKHLLPIIAQNLKKGCSVRVFGDVENITNLRKRVVAYLVNEEFEKMVATGKIPTEQDIQVASSNIEQRLKEEGDLFFSTVEDIIVSGIDTEISVTNEGVDNNIMFDKLINAAKLLPEYSKELLMEAVDLLGITLSPKTTPEIPQVGQQGQGQPADAAMMSSLNQQQQFTNANVPQSYGR